MELPPLSEADQRRSFAQFLRQGLHHVLIPGVSTYEQILAQFNLPRLLERLEFGVTRPWFQDLFFWFHEDGRLMTLELRLNPLTEEYKTLPKALQLDWLPFARELTPEAFEVFVREERIPCIKANRLYTPEVFYPPRYSLDHLAMDARFDEREPGSEVYTLRSFHTALIRVELVRMYTTISPKEPLYLEYC